jgi:hypothetical protein
VIRRYRAKQHVHPRARLKSPAWPDVTISRRRQRLTSCCLARALAGDDPLRNTKSSDASPEF